MAGEALSGWLGDTTLAFPAFFQPVHVLGRHLSDYQYIGLVGRVLSALFDVGTILAVFLLVPAASRAAGEGALPEAREWKNPHLALDCRDCHARIPEKGKSTPAEVIAGLKAEPVAVCRDCHEASVTSHHPVVQKTERKLPEGLPLGPGGEVICSTCHDVHLKVRVTVLLRGFDTGRYSVRMDMCLDCHAENFYALNPHRVEKASERCYTCHPAIGWEIPGEPLNICSWLTGW